MSNMKTINSYELIWDEPKSSSSSVFWQAKKDNELFFLKRFNDPSRPSDRVSAEIAKLKNDKCEHFSNERKTINDAIMKLGGGNFVAPTDFFLYERRYYQVTPWRDIKKKTLAEIVSLSEKEKLLILKTAANSLKLLHNIGIIHCDIKPDNLPVTVTESKKFTCSLIDFDSSHFENDIPAPDDVWVTDPYMSPELASYKMRKNYYGDKKFDVKNDVFAAAIVFHCYWSGEDFIYDPPSKGPYLYNAVLEGKSIAVSDKIPDAIKHILLRMIDKNPENRPSMGEVLEYLKQIDVNTLQKNVVNTPTHQTETHSVENQVPSYSKGPGFPEDAESFSILRNGNVLIYYKDGNKIAYKIDKALNKEYLIKN